MLYACFMFMRNNCKVEWGNRKSRKITCVSANMISHSYHLAKTPQFPNEISSPLFSLLVVPLRKVIAMSEHSIYTHLDGKISR